MTPPSRMPWDREDVVDTEEEEVIPGVEYVIAERGSGERGGVRKPSGREPVEEADAGRGRAGGGVGGVNAFFARARKLFLDAVEVAEEVEATLSVDFDALDDLAARGCLAAEDPAPA